MFSPRWVLCYFGLGGSLDRLRENGLTSISLGRWGLASNEPGLDFKQCSSKPKGVWALVVPRLKFSLIALCAMFGLLAQGTASARSVPAMLAAAHAANFHQARSGTGTMHHEASVSPAMEGCDDCPNADHKGRPCNDCNHCLASAGFVLLLPGLEPLASSVAPAAYLHQPLPSAELSGLAAPPATEPPIRSA